MNFSPPSPPPMLSLPSRVTAYKNASGGPPLKYAGIWTNGDDYIAVYERLCPPDLRTGFKTLPHVGEMGALFKRIILPILTLCVFLVLKSSRRSSRLKGITLPLAKTNRSRAFSNCLNILCAHIKSLRAIVG
ncbi:hypothetical protein CIHG_01843 [Coccidioides immitis H538.4]|uniref:Uncharacterized protein n=1 Tax=Coccidioides immitis H538.4 TaxID=396776 RepID=A0A0J8RGL8_COCIT|nr:hypothetical protein CIHG_01843 [Coccidioides immitis H538.4]